MGDSNNRYLCSLLLLLRLSLLYFESELVCPLNRNKFYYQNEEGRVPSHFREPVFSAN